MARTQDFTPFAPELQRSPAVRPALRGGWGSQVTLYLWPSIRFAYTSFWASYAPGINCDVYRFHQSNITLYLYIYVFFSNPVWSVLWSSREAFIKRLDNFSENECYFLLKSFPIPCCKSTNCQLSSQSSQNKLDIECSVCIQKWRWESFRFPSQISYYKYLHNLISVTRKYC